MELLPDPRILASEMDAAIRCLTCQYTPVIRSIRRSYSQKIESATHPIEISGNKPMVFIYQLRVAVD